MKLEIGDFVEFKNYEDMTDDENMWIGKKFFPLSGKVKEINVSGCDRYFRITGSKYIFSKGSVERVISDYDDVDINSLKPGDEVLVKATIKDTFNGSVELIPLVKKTDVTKILKRKEPEYFIVQENHYGMYIGFARTLVSDKGKAKLHTSLGAANEAATDMQLDDWDVIPYDD